MFSSERAEILALLKASAEPMSPRQVAEALGKHPNTVSTLLGRMVRDGEAKTVGYGKYLSADTIASVASVASSPLKERKKTRDNLLEKNGNTTEATEATEAMPMQTTPPEAVEDDEPTEPPADFVAFVDTAAQITHSRVAQISPLDDFSATMTPDALQPAAREPARRSPGRLMATVPASSAKATASAASICARTAPAKRACPLGTLPGSMTAANPARARSASSARRRRRLPRAGRRRCASAAG